MIVDIDDSNISIKVEIDSNRASIDIIGQHATISGTMTLIELEDLISMLKVHKKIMEEK